MYPTELMETAMTNRELHQSLRINGDLTRREWLSSAAAAVVGIGAAGRLARASTLAAPIGILVYATPTCGCCRAWMDHLEHDGFTVSRQFIDDVSPIKQKRHVPDKLWSCHTAIVGAYTIEGHVPADLIHAILAKKPSLAGLAVPGMPNGAPGMEGAVKDRYDVIAFTNEGKTAVYASR